MTAISTQIWDMKYRFKAADGTPIDQDMAETWARVALALAQAEKPEVRAARRSKEVADLSYETVATDLARRDALDQGREDSPLREADDAFVIDTSDLTVDEIVDTILKALP